MGFGKGLGAPVPPRAPQSPRPRFAPTAAPQQGPSASGAVGGTGAPPGPSGPSTHNHPEHVRTALICKTERAPPRHVSPVVPKPAEPSALCLARGVCSTHGVLNRESIPHPWGWLVTRGCIPQDAGLGGIFLPFLPRPVISIFPLPWSLALRNAALAHSHGVELSARAALARAEDGHRSRGHRDPRGERGTLQRWAGAWGALLGGQHCSDMWGATGAASPGLTSLPQFPHLQQG